MEAINAFLAGDTSAGKAILHDLINATVGFESLAVAVSKPSQSLHRMLAPRGNPNTENFFAIVSALQKKTKVRLRVTSRWSIEPVATLPPWAAWRAPRPVRTARPRAASTQNTNAFVRSPAFARTPGSGSSSKRRVRNLMIEVVSYGVLST